MFKHASQNCVKLVIKTNNKHLMKRLHVLIVLLAASSSLFAQTTWTIDRVHSKIGFSVTHMAVADTEGRFNEYEETVLTKNDNFDGAEVTFTAKVSSIDTDNERRDGHLKSADFFDAEKYAELTFMGNLVKNGSGSKLKG